MAHSFDKNYWEQHWGQPSAVAGGHGAHPNPYVVDAARALRPGKALDAGCGAGVEAIWLAAHGWQVTGADISGRALATAKGQAHDASVADMTTWIEADLTSWNPPDRWDLVVTSYAHPAMPQLAFYQRIAQWVAPGGTLLIVGHRHHHSGDTHGHGSTPPDEASVTLSEITASLDPATWRVDTAEEHSRPLPTPGGDAVLHDVVVKATRLT
ncbi:class I SAM-dependent methyltransferase [Actinopolymorpha alba]|uniref:class I SAM-dependent methyltransferase n=1 Tax=Actinopolymorpha alba TaxID=533267 RepID=UPI000368855C|nr:class I SAM-dependent methyltransferase [Actinopolymorpha alba]